MAIYKNIKSAENDLSKFSFPTIDLEQEVIAETVEFNKDEYMAYLNEAKEKGYKEGLEKGYEESYKNGLLDLEKEREDMLLYLDKKKENLDNLIISQGAEYVNTFQKDIKNLILNSMNKVFIDCLTEEIFMNSYMEKQIEFITENFKDCLVYINKDTITSVGEDMFVRNDINYEIDNDVQKYDVLIKSKNEYKEYFLSDKLEKLRELFI